jgi:hypothetical protein
LISCRRAAWPPPLGTGKSTLKDNGLYLVLILAFPGHSAISATILSILFGALVLPCVQNYQNTGFLLYLIQAFSAASKWNRCRKAGCPRMSVDPTGAWDCRQMCGVCAAHLLHSVPRGRQGSCCRCPGCFGVWHRPDHAIHTPGKLVRHNYQGSPTARSTQRSNYMCSCILAPSATRAV